MVTPPNEKQTTSKTLHALQRKNHELAKMNACLSIQMARMHDQQLKLLEEKVAEQEARIAAERKLMEAMTALDVLKVEVGRRVPVMRAVSDYLNQSADLFEQLLCLDYGEILIERFKQATVSDDDDSVGDKRHVKMPSLLPISEE